MERMGQNVFCCSPNDSTIDRLGPFTILSSPSESPVGAIMEISTTGGPSYFTIDKKNLQPFSSLSISPISSVFESICLASSHYRSGRTAVDLHHNNLNESIILYRNRLLRRASNPPHSRLPAARSVLRVSLAANRRISPFLSLSTRFWLFRRKRSVTFAGRRPHFSRSVQ
jgi:hypothetical protein